MRAAALAALTLLAAAMPAAAAERSVTMMGRAYDPPNLVALAGDTVTWVNGDHENHTVTDDDDGGFDSGLLHPGERFSVTFAQPSFYPYACTIHKFMHGTVAVYGLALSGPADGAPLGHGARLTGLAPSGTASVEIRRRTHGAAAFTALLTVAPAADGSFAVRLPAGPPSSYIAVTGGLTSPTVGVAVRPRVRLAVRRTGSRIAVTVASEPALPGAAVVLERYVLERFAWVPVAHGRLGAGSTLRLRVSEPGRVFLRARVPQGRDGYRNGVSPYVVVARQRTA